MFHAAISASQSDIEAVEAAMVGHAVGIDAPFQTVVELLSQDAETATVAVLDDDRRPIGAIREIDVRAFLLNPFAHALIQNPALKRDLRPFVRPVPTAEIDAGLSPMLALISAEGGQSALAVTREGRFLGLIGSGAMLRLAADREAAIGAERAVRLARIGAASATMRAEAAALSAEIDTIAATLLSAADETGVRAGEVGQQGLSVAAAAEQAVTNVQDIATEGRALAGELDRLGDEATAAHASSIRASDLMDQGERRADELAIAAVEIEQVTAAIDKIARTINMLAINATIEAARAGDAGRGFAVVAAEVKALSNRSREATSLISTKLAAVHASVRNVTDSHHGLTDVIANLRGLSEGIERAVTRNSAATRTIASHVDDAATANDLIRRNAAAINDAAEGSRQEAHAIAAVATQLTGSAATLQQRLTAFLDEVQAA
ncbi:methyl-accepting chemotaxis protein [Sphingomonas crocodyli]|uniref:Chemotaxis protein n=1 Tax=Sphingomonas crocodyli TaxID=1979270 RepID=A0A437LWN5_9SPHN|nr:methyl-accepting chemotaxis protein [Sphingomonas crocodyli]RVT89804.1 chemotaxis protein [Sphingomonas crocodyli]